MRPCARDRPATPIAPAASHACRIARLLASCPLDISALRKPGFAAHGRFYWPPSAGALSSGPVDDVAELDAAWAMQRAGLAAAGGACGRVAPCAYPRARHETPRRFLADRKTRHACPRRDD